MRHRCISQAWVQRTYAMAITCVALEAMGRATATDLKDDDLKLGVPFWEPSLSLRLGAGYKDNVTLSHAAPESSSFERAGLDATLIRLPYDGTQVFLSLSGDDTRYFTSKSIDHEDTVFAQGEIRRYIGDWQLALSLEGAYFDQVLDLSVTESNQFPVPVRGGVMTARPAVRRDFGQGYWIALELPASRDYLDEPLDDYWEVGPRVTLGQIWGKRSEVTLTYAYTYRDYDNQLALDASGAPIPGVIRAAYQHDAILALRFYFDEKRHWRSKTAFAVRQSSDNASGYFDYGRIQVGEQIRYETKDWLINAEVRLGSYDFPVQAVNGPGTEKRARTDFIFNARAERQVAKHVRLYAQFEREETVSNLKLDEYDVNTVSAGVMVDF